MTNNDLNYKEYAKLAGGFYPSKFNAAEWVSAIKASGAKYICFTTRHHEGFSMFHSQYSEYNIVTDALAQEKDGIIPEDFSYGQRKLPADFDPVSSAMIITS